MRLVASDTAFDPKYDVAFACWALAAEPSEPEPNSCEAAQKHDISTRRERGEEARHAPPHSSSSPPPSPHPLSESPEALRSNSRGVSPPPPAAEGVAGDLRLWDELLPLPGTSSAVKSIISGLGLAVGAAAEAEAEAEAEAGGSGVVVAGFGAALATGAATEEVEAEAEEDEEGVASGAAGFFFSPPMTSCEGV